MALSLPSEVYFSRVEQLDLSARTLNSLKRAHFDKVGEVLEKNRSDLLKIRNFGDKSLEELYSRLDQLGFLPKEQPAEESEPSIEDSEETPPAEEEPQE